MNRRCKTLWEDVRGTDYVEYVLLTGLMGSGVIWAMTHVSQPLNAIFGSTGDVFTRMTT